MNDTDDDFLFDEPEDTALSFEKDDISKTQRKKQSTELQKIGEELLGLNKRQLEQIEVEEPLLGALREYQRIPPRHEARRRQLQYIGKLMRKANHEHIRAALEKLRAPDRQEARRSQEIERWGERLLAGDAADIEAFVEAWPAAERQNLRQLMRRCQQLSAPEEQAPARRRLFDYVKSCIN